MKRGFLKTNSKNKTVAAVPSYIADPETDVTHTITIPTGVAVPFSPPNCKELGDMSKVKNYVITSLTYKKISLDLGDASTTMVIYDGMKESILRLPAFTDISLSLDNSKPYSICSVAGAGVGMFATKDIEPGEIVACEHPLLVMPQGFVLVKGQEKRLIAQASHLLEQTISRGMTEDNRVAFLALNNCKGKGEIPYYGIIETNALGIDCLPGHDGEFLCVCNEISRINHSCAPNTRPYWDLKAFTMVVRATDRIHVGDQIFISYLSEITAPRALRQREMLEKYAFQCACISCALPKTESSRSDICRSVIAASAADPADESELRLWAGNLDAPDDQLIARSERLVEFMQKEKC